MVTSFNDFDRTSFVARVSSGVYTSRATARALRVVRARRGRVSRAPRESDATADARTRVARSVRALHASLVVYVFHHSSFMYSMRSFSHFSRKL